VFGGGEVSIRHLRKKRKRERESVGRREGRDGRELGRARLTMLKRGRGVFCEVLGLYTVENR